MRNNTSTRQTQSEVDPNAPSGRAAGIVMTLVFVGIFFLAGGRLLTSFASQSWPTTQGTVTRSNVDASRDSQDSWAVEFEYRYNVEKANYSGNLVTFGVRDALRGFNRGQAGSHDFVQEYLPDSKVTVHYNPKKPSESVLKPGPTIGLYYFIAFSLFVIFAHLEYEFERLQGITSLATPMAFVRTLGFAVFFIGGMLSAVVPEAFSALGDLISPNQARKAPATNVKVLDKQAASEVAASGQSATQGRYQLKDPDKIDALFKQAVATKERAFGPASPQLYDTLIEYAYYFEGIKQPTKAIPIYLKADQVWIKILPTTNWHDHSLGIHNLATQLQAVGRNKEAIAEYQNMIKAEEKIQGSDSLLVANTLRGLADAYEAQKMFKEEESALKQAVAITKTTAGENTADYYYALRDLGNGQLAAGEKAQAKATFTDALAHAQKVFAANNTDLQEAKNQLDDASH